MVRGGDALLLGNVTALQRVTLLLSLCGRLAPAFLLSALLLTRLAVPRVALLA